MILARSAVARKAKRKVERKLTKGFIGRRSNCNRIMGPAILKKLQYSYEHRKMKKAQFKQVWIQRISAALYPYNISYSSFINIMKNNHVQINRKSLSTMAYHDKASFDKLVTKLLELKSEKENTSSFEVAI